MTKRNLFLSVAAAVALTCGAIGYAQGPVVNIDDHRHPNLAGAQSHIVEAYRLVDRAQADNHDQLGGHAEKAKEFLEKADAELRAAATVANKEGR